MTDEQTPPTPVPPAAQPPYPEQTAPHPQRDEALENLPEHAPAASDGPAIGALGVTLIGGAVAAAVGALVAIPLLRRARQKPKARARATAQARRPRRKNSTD
jgi:hypothetical protein